MTARGAPRPQVPAARAVCALLLVVAGAMLAGCAVRPAPAAPAPPQSPASAPAALPAPAMCVPEGASCAAADARCCPGLLCIGSRRPTCMPRY